MKQLLYVSILLLTLGAVGTAAQRAGLFKIREVKVVLQSQEAPFLLPKEKQIQDQLDRVKGQSLWSVNISELNRELLQQEWIKDVQIIRRFPFFLLVKVVPQEVSMVLITPHGQMLPLASEGKLLSAIPANEVPDLPLLRGKVFFDSLEMRKKALDLLKQLPSSGKLNINSISEISFDDREGFQLSLRGSNAKVQMGQDQFAQKASRVSQVLNYLDANALESRVIDATFSKKVLVRLRKAP